MFFLKDLPTRNMVDGYARRYPDLDAKASLAALHTMRRASLMVRALEAFFAKHDLSQLRFLVLIVIDREPDRSELTINEIAERLDVSKPVMTRTLAKLEDDQLVSITKAKTDTRYKFVRVSEAGHAKLNALLPEYFALLSALGREMDQ